MKPSYHYFVRVFWSGEDECFIAEVPELPGCSGLGATEADAIREARRSIAGWLEVARKEGVAIPKPICQGKADRLNLRIPSDLVNKIRRSAKESGLSLNQFVMTKLMRMV